MTYEEWKRRKQCEGKTRYATRLIAKRGRRTAVRGLHSKISDFTIYQCPSCELWHIGHTSEQTRRRQIEEWS